MDNQDAIWYNDDTIDVNSTPLDSTMANTDVSSTTVVIPSIEPITTSISTRQLTRLDSEQAVTLFLQSNNTAGSG